MKRLVACLIVALVAACTESTPAPTTEAPPTPETSAVPPTTTTEPTPPPDRFRTSTTTDDLGWEHVTLPEGTGPYAGVIAWTGEELIFWGGDDSLSVPRGEPGLAYDLDTGMWRELSPSPKRATQGAASVWTGSELIICCGARSSFTAVSYDPVTDRWRALSDPPTSGEYLEAVWTGDVMLVAGPGGVMSYDPVSDVWTEQPNPPRALGRLNAVAWTGSELVVWPATIERHVHVGMALSPETGLWRDLGEPPAWPAGVDIAWTGEDLIIWGGLPALSGGSERAVGSRLNWEEDHWYELPEALPEPDGCECNLGSQELLWTGRELLVWTGFFSTGYESGEPLLLSYRPDTGAWYVVAESPIEWSGQSLMADNRIVIKGDDSLAISPAGWGSDGTPLDLS